MTVQCKTVEQLFNAKRWNQRHQCPENQDSPYAVILLHCDPLFENAPCVTSLETVDQDQCALSVHADDEVCLHLKEDGKCISLKDDCQCR